MHRGMGSCNVFQKSCEGARGRQTMGSELEWKYAAAGQPLLERVYGETAGEWRETAMETRYFDTAAGALSARKWTLRLRRENGVPVVCLKTPGSALHGACARGEWEWQGDSVTGAIPALLALGAPPELETLCAAKPLRPLCGAAFTRRAVTVTLADASLELALDFGVLTGGEKRLPLCELEVEHKSGNPRSTGAFAERLAARYGLLPEPKSKFLRALELTF